jgi:two-component system CheB/CheR fusion protein
MESMGVEFTTAMDMEPIYVDGDPARLQQINVNLLSNAYKYTPRGGHVSIEAKQDAGAAVIRVRDDGAGISSDMLESVFDLFVQSNRTLERAAGGLGVGLTLTRSLVTMHGGTVTAHSAGEGLGSEFVVRLPLASPATTEARATPLRRGVDEGAKIVVVEDNEDTRDVLCELLRCSGFDCRAADSGVSGLTLIDEFRPAIAILDVGLPGMDGFEMARRLRADEKHAGMWLIALTGYGQVSDRARGRKAGFDEHLVKPIESDGLLDLLAGLRGAKSPGHV